MTKINKLKKQLQELQNSTVKEKNNNGIFNNVNKVESSARKCTKPIILLIQETQIDGRCKKTSNICLTELVRIVELFLRTRYSIFA